MVSPADRDSPRMAREWDLEADQEAEIGQRGLAKPDAVVALAAGFYYAGNCGCLDHGQGSMAYHLSQPRGAAGRCRASAWGHGPQHAFAAAFRVFSLGRQVDPEPLFLYDAPK